ncbi:DUF4326 domain-containing protein [Nocardia jinanensis]|uniref:DUF4326 domain-containing protein n=1 Tax=Nocardia jinanensis TaxID=382504 RepID=UPI0007A505BB|nr:DUF4326 domain-containing protein [Nocardia jinanensis]
MTANTEHRTGASGEQSPVNSEQRPFTQASGTEHRTATLTPTEHSARAHRSPGRAGSQQRTPVRVQRRRVRGWRRPATGVIVDRTSRFGNPHTVGNQPGSPTEQHAAAVRRYVQWLDGEGPDVIEQRSRRFDRRWVLAHLPNLRGRDLCCPCEPGLPCHADVLLHRANA